MDEQLLQLDPTKVQADDNARFNLKQTAVDELKNSILEHGGVMEPVEVEPLSGVKGFTHRLTMGFYRHAAVLAANAEGAGLKLPAIVRETATGTDRLKRQIAENNNRESLSPMDKALAIKKLKDSGVEAPEIRRIFSSAGGRKGNTVQPMSNAMLNIHLRMLDLPKSIQEKIHDGRIGVEGAYMLGKVPPEKRAAVLERAEADRHAQVEQEEKDEAKYLEIESKAAEAAAKVIEAQTAVETARAEVATADTKLKEAKDAMKAARDVPGFLEMDDAGKKTVTDGIKAAEVAVKLAEKFKKDSQNRLAKALEATKTAEEKAADRRAALDASQKPAKKKASTKPIGKADVQKAAKSEGTAAGHVPLSMSDIRVLFRDLQRDGVPAPVVSIAQAVKRCLDGQDTTKELVLALTAIVENVRAGGDGVVAVQAAAAAPKKVAAKK